MLSFIIITNHCQTYMLLQFISNSLFWLPQDRMCQPISILNICHSEFNPFEFDVFQHTVGLHIFTAIFIFDIEWCLYGAILKENNRFLIQLFETILKFLPSKYVIITGKKREQVRLISVHEKSIRAAKLDGSWLRWKMAKNSGSLELVSTKSLDRAHSILHE